MDIVAKRYLLIGSLVIVGLSLFLFILTASQRVGLSPEQAPAAVSVTPVPQSSSGPHLLTPQAGDSLTGPLVIKGFVPKSWTFEGQFQMKLLDAGRQLIIQGRVPVEWDNENTKETLYFVEAYNYHTSSFSGYLVLENDNPSGLPENSRSIEIPVKFSSSFPGTYYIFDQPTQNPQIDSQCQVVLPRSVFLGKTQTPIKDLINLWAKTLDQNYSVTSVNLKNGLLTLEFPEIPGITTGGSCAQSINRLQIEKTALQFPEVTSVRFVPDSLWQP